MNIRVETERKISFNARDELMDKIDKLTVMMSKLAATDSDSKRPFKLQIHKSKVRTETMIKEIIKIEIN